MKSLVVQSDKAVHKPNVLLVLPSAIAIYSVFFPILLLDLWVRFYQAFYFRIMHIPFVPREDFVVIDRYDLSELTITQKLNCLYCEYANGTLAWLKAVANQTEIYSCAIKHKTQPKGQEHQQNFYEYNEFSDSKF
jgi:hypothetical protein